MPAAHLAIQYAEACANGNHGAGGAAVDEAAAAADALLAFEAAPSPAVRAAVTLAELGRLAGVSGEPASPSPLFACSALAPELAAAVCAALTAGGDGPAAASSAVALLRAGAGPALAASIAVNVPGALDAVCAALLASSGAALGEPARAALGLVADVGPAGTAAVADAALRAAAGLK